METSGAVGANDSATRRRLIDGLGTLSPGPLPSQPGGRRGVKDGGNIYSQGKGVQGELKERLIAYVSLQWCSSTVNVGVNPHLHRHGYPHTDRHTKDSLVTQLLIQPS